MSDERRKALDALGFIWDPYDVAWKRRFDELKAFKDERGHCNVPTNHGKLGLWVASQRRAYKGRKGNLSGERRKALDALGFISDPRDVAWYGKLDELRAFKAKRGHCDVPQNHGKLGIWVNNQRRAYKGHQRGNQSDERRKALDDLGFIWDHNDVVWNLRFDELKAFKDERGHCKVPRSHGELGMWVKNLRKRRSGVSDERRKALDALGFIWTP